jgi:hypothetical protein
VRRAAPLLIALAALTGCAASTAPTTILSSPSGARVFVDGELAGETPLDVELEKHTHRVRLEKEGYQPTTDHISVRVRTEGELIPRLYAYVMGLTGMYDAKYTFEDAYSFTLEKEQE